MCGSIDDTQSVTQEIGQHRHSLFSMLSPPLVTWLLPCPQHLQIQVLLSPPWINCNPQQLAAGWHAAQSPFCTRLLRQAITKMTTTVAATRRPAHSSHKTCEKLYLAHMQRSYAAYQQLVGISNDKRVHKGTYWNNKAWLVNKHITKTWLYWLQIPSTI